MTLEANNYHNNLTYAAWPSSHAIEHNSNSYTHSVAECAGATASVAWNSFVGGYKLIPCTDFN